MTIRYWQCVLVLAMCLLSSASYAQAPPPGPQPVADPLLKSICGDTATPLQFYVPAPPAVAAAAEFEVALDGGMTRQKHGKRGAVAFFSAAERAQLDAHQIIVRVDAISSIDPLADKTPAAPIMCGDFVNATNLSHPLLLSAVAMPGRTDVWRLTVYFTPEAAKKLKFKKPKKLNDDSVTADMTKAKEEEKAFVYTRLAAALDGDVKTITNYYNAAAAPAAAPTLAQLKVAVDNVALQTDTLVRFADQDNVAKQYPIAKEALTALRPDEAAVHSKAQSIANELNAPAPDTAKLHLLVDEFLVQWSNSIKANAKPQLKPDCRMAWLTNYFAEPDTAKLWVFGAFELPTTDQAHTLELSGTGASVPARDIQLDSRITAWATNIVTPHPEITFLWDAGGSTAPDSFKAIAGFLSVLAGKVVGAVGGAGFNALESLAIPAECRQPPDGLKWPLAPLATFDSVARTSAAAGAAGLLRDRSYTVYACTGRCVVTGSSKTSFTQIQAKTPAGWGLTLFGTFNYDVRVSPEGAGFTKFEWRPTTPAGGVTQAFKLAEVKEPLQSISTSLLLTLLLPEIGAGRVGVGFGPSIVYGNGAGALKQWTLNLLYLPCFMKHTVTDRLYFTLGGGFRLFDRPLLNKVGDTTVLSVTNQQTPAAPKITAVRGDVAPVIALGFAVDLAILGDAATAVFGTKLPAAGGGGTQ